MRKNIREKFNTDEKKIYIKWGKREERKGGRMGKGKEWKKEIKEAGGK